MTRLLRLIKLGVIILFFSLLLLRISMDISWYNSIRLTNLLLPATIILILVYKSKVSWLTAVLIFTCGIYYYLFESTKIAYPRQFEFTLPLTEFIFGDKHGYKTENKLLILIFGLFPFVFYISALFAFLTKQVMRQYFTRII